MANDKDCPRVNGHVVIKQYPVQRLFLTSGDATIRLSIDYKRSPTGKADVYMHRKCCERTGGQHEDSALYDVMLIEKEYTLSYDDIDFAAGRIRVVDLPEKLTPEQLYKAAMATKKKELSNKNRPYTRDMIDSDFVEEEDYPFSIDKAFS